MCSSDLLAFIGFGVLLPIHLKNYKVSASICNHDMQGYKFVYKAPLTKEQVLQTLSTHCDTDILSCSINKTEQIMHFEGYHDSKDFFFLLKDMEDGTMILLRVVYKFGMRSQVPNQLNPFMVEKLNATLLPYSEYQNEFWD